MFSSILANRSATSVIPSVPAYTASVTSSTAVVT